MKNKKKINAICAVAIALIVLIAVLLYSFFFAGDREPSLGEIVENRVVAYETDFLDSTVQMTSQSTVTKYLVNWAENKGINVKKDKNNNIIYSFDATEGLEDREPVVILCGYDYSCIQSYKNSIVCSLTVAKNDKPHGEYKIIFVSEENGDSSAVDKLSSDYFTENTQVIYLGNDTTSKIANATGAVSEYEFTRDISMVEPSYDKAFKVTISGMPAEKITEKTASYPNPIKQLGNLLATFKSKSVLFELADFNGGSLESAATVTEASMTIVVNEDSKTKVMTRLDNAIESFNDKYSDKYPQATYTYEEVEMPARVFTTDDTESLVSLLYTAPNGKYDNEDESSTDAAFTSIRFISSENQKIKIKFMAGSNSEALLNEITEAYQTICSLTDINYAQTLTKPSYNVNKQGQDLAIKFTESYKKFKTTDLPVEGIPEYSMCSLVSQKYPELPLIAAYVTNKTADNFAGGLIVHLGYEE